MSRKKVRFIVKQDGQPREVFAVKEGSKGDLTVSLRSTAFLSREGKPWGEDDRLLSQKISVHRSDNSIHSGRSIVQTQITADGNEERISAFIKNSKRTLYWQLYSFLCPDLSDDRYEPSSSAIAATVEIAPENPEYSCLMFHIFATAKERKAVTVYPYRLSEFSFKLFNIAVYCNYLNMPRSGLGIGAALPTRPSMIDRKETRLYSDVAKRFPNGAVVLKDEEVGSVLFMLNASLVTSYNSAILRTNPELEAEIESYQKFFTHDPISAERPNLVVGPPPTPWNPPTPQ